MSYLDQSEIATNAAMAARVTQCAAEQDAPDDPDRWAYGRRFEWAAAPGWDDAWAYAKAGHPPDPEQGDTYDPGADEAVITDAMILSQVQAMLGA